MNDENETYEPETSLDDEDARLNALVELASPELAGDGGDETSEEPAPIGGGDDEWEVDEQDRLVRNGEPVTDGDGNPIYGRDGKVFDYQGNEVSPDLITAATPTVPEQPSAPTVQPTPQLAVPQGAQASALPWEADVQGLRQAWLEDLQADGFDPNDENDAKVIERKLRLKEMEFNTQMRHARGPVALADAMQSLDADLAKLPAERRQRVKSAMSSFAPDKQGSPRSGMAAILMDAIDAAQDTPEGLWQAIDEVRSLRRSAPPVQRNGTPPRARSSAPATFVPAPEVRRFSREALDLADFCGVSAQSASGALKG